MQESAEPAGGGDPVGSSDPAIEGLPEGERAWWAERGWPPPPYELTEALVLAASLIPAGHAVSYGDLAALLGAGGPRQAGRAMAGAPEGTPWWRVVRADGSLPPSLSERAARHYRRERTPLRPEPTEGPAHHTPGHAPRRRVDLRRARWRPDAAHRELLERLRAACGPLR